jgi:hypothetical protein
MRSYPSAMLALLMILTLAARGHSTPGAAKDMANAANRWLDSLSADQRRGATFGFTDAERENWHYVPKARLGLPLGQMNDAQRQLARDLLASGLSHPGLLQADSVIALEDVLRAVEGAAHRDRQLYFFTVFGQPSESAPWGWRVEGHHLSINFTVAPGGKISATPNFVGANPAEVRVESPQKGKRPLAAEEDLGRELVQSLDPAQRGQAIVSNDAPGDILTRNDKQANPLEPAGLGYAAMTAAQQQKFQSLVGQYAHRLRPEVADAELAKIADAGWGRLSFAWAGSIEAGAKHYYRIQSPAFVIEYDNTQNNANHVHTVWRVLSGDFGRDLLKEHYETSRHN